jgi:hypothetical protein
MCRLHDWIDSRVGFLLVRVHRVRRSRPASGVRVWTADGKPDLSGIWQAVNTAAWDIQDHQAQRDARE